jgi:hypothetical protein
LPADEKEIIVVEVTWQCLEIIEVPKLLTDACTQ